MSRPSSPASGQGSTERQITIAGIQEKIVDLTTLWQYHTDHEESHQDLLGTVLPTFPTTKGRIPATTKVDEKLTGMDALLAHDEEETDGAFAWIEHTWAQSVVGFVILLNAVLIGLETDYMSPCWVPFEHAILFFFTVEWGLKLARYGFAFFSSFGNIFDSFVLISGAADLWVVPFYSWIFHRKQGQSALLKIMQLLRLLRIVRLIRLVRIIKPLYSLALGIAQACQGMFWVLIFLFMMLYAVSILTARLLGIKDGEGYQEDAGGDSAAYHVRAMFDSVLSSMFILFESITCWSLMDFVPLFKVVKGSRLVAVIFYIFANWALLAVLTGVVSEKMMAVKERIHSETAEDENKTDKGYGLAEEVLKELFRKADTDGSGAISLDEFNNMLLCTDVMKPLMLHSALDAQDLADLFQWLDTDKDQHVDANEFLQGFRWLIANIDPKGLLKLEEELGAAISSLKKELVARVDFCFDRFMTAVAIPIRKIVAVTEQIQRLDKVLDNLRDVASDGQESIVCETLDQTERRLSERIDLLTQAVAKIDRLQQAGLLTLRTEFLEDHESTVARMLQSGGILKKVKKKKDVPFSKEVVEEEADEEEEEEELIFFEPQWEDNLSEEDVELPAGIGKSDRRSMSSREAQQQRLSM